MIKRLWRAVTTFFVDDNAVTEALEVVDLIERLCADTMGCTLTFMCENEEGNGPDNHAVNVSGWHTDWEDVRYHGHTRLDALRKAFEAYEEKL